MDIGWTWKVFGFVISAGPINTLSKGKGGKDPGPSGNGLGKDNKIKIVIAIVMGFAEVNGNLPLIQTLTLLSL
jgi:hypothetical protein